MLFLQYLNSLNLKDNKGKKLTLDKQGNGTFKEFIRSKVIESAEEELKKGTDLSNVNWITVKDKKVTSVDFSKLCRISYKNETNTCF